MHIGLIGGIGPAATDFYHRGLIERHHAANIPLDLTIAYADVRTMSQGRATYTMQFLHYAEVPHSIAEKLTENQS